MFWFAVVIAELVGSLDVKISSDNVVFAKLNMRYDGGSAWDLFTKYDVVSTFIVRFQFEFVCIFFIDVECGRKT